MTDPTDPLDDWLLTSAERGNDATRLVDRVPGNACTPLVHGATYFARLVEEVEALAEGDHLFFTDWRGDAWQKLGDDGPTVGALFSDAARRGVVVRGLVWRSHSETFTLNKEANQGLDTDLEESGGQVILDQRVHRFGSHHQKLVVLRHPSEPERDVAFIGGIDLCNSRRDDARHLGDPQALAMAQAYGATPAWHDVQLEVRGPAVAAFDCVFRERWEDPTNADSHNPLARIVDTWKGARLDPTALPDVPPEPEPVGRQTVQVLRTYPVIRPRYDFAPRGEFSIARGYTKAIRKATRLIYVEDQYMWSQHIAQLLADALRTDPDLHLVVVVPRVPDQEGALAVLPNRIGQRQALRVCEEAGPDRVHVFSVENPEGTPVYVHAKVCVIDDAWASVGSDNMNRRSWTHDSELTAAVVDAERDEREPRDPRGDGLGARRFARDLRLELAREHLDLEDGDAWEGHDLLDPDGFVAALEASAARLDQWYADGRPGRRPPGRVRRHSPASVPWYTQLWSRPVYRLLHDPDGRTVGRRWRGQF